MGLYINPTNMSKENLLLQVGRTLSAREFKAWDFTNRSEIPVALVDNGLFTAAGVAFDRRELEAFTSPEDRRPRTYFAVPVSVLRDEAQSGIPAESFKDYMPARYHA